MKVNVLKAKRWLFISLMGMLGFTSCCKDNEEEEPRIVPMYGVVETTFKLEEKQL